MAVQLRFADVDGKPACVPVWDVVIHRGDGEGGQTAPEPDEQEGFNFNGGRTHPHSSGWATGWAGPQ